MFVSNSDDLASVVSAGNTGIGPILMKGPLVGDLLFAALDRTGGVDGADLKANFEAAVSVSGQLQQTASLDLSAKTIVFIFKRPEPSDINKPRNYSFENGLDYSPRIDKGGDYRNSKNGLGRVFNENAIAVAWEDLEPLITPQLLKEDHLLGIPLVSAVRDPSTGKADVWNSDILKRVIVRSVSICEVEGKFDIFPKQYREKEAFDRVQYQSFGYFQLRHRPVSSLQQLTVTTASEQSVYQVPLDWIDIGYLRQGQINILPLTISIKDGAIVPLLAGPGGSAFLSIFGNHPWLASFWEAIYTTGFPENKLPRIVNEYIGVVAAMEVLSAIGATYSRSTSTSLGLDGLSQSVSGPGAQIYVTRLKELASKRQWIRTRLQSQLGVGTIIDNV
jgi:hypothetical protein